MAKTVKTTKTNTDVAFERLVSESHRGLTQGDALTKTALRVHQDREALSTVVRGDQRANRFFMMIHGVASGAMGEVTRRAIVQQARVTSLLSEGIIAERAWSNSAIVLLGASSLAFLGFGVQAFRDNGRIRGISTAADIVVEQLDKQAELSQPPNVSAFGAGDVSFLASGAGLESEPRIDFIPPASAEPIA